MTMTERKVIKAKVGLLELAKQLGSVTQACRVMGYSRDSFYRYVAARVMWPPPGKGPVSLA
jgi:molybdenum-dependent DNA-binding transcriptional regulator ModE